MIQAAAPLPTSQVLYTAAGFAKRAKGQRYDKDLLRGTDLIAVLDNPRVGPAFGLPAGSTYRELGQFNGFGDWGEPCVYTAGVCTLANGTQVPVYRKYAPGQNYMVCQNLSYKAIIVK